MHPAVLSSVIELVGNYPLTVSVGEEIAGTTPTSVGPRPLNKARDDSSGSSR